MLKDLRIQNYAILEQVDVSFQDGLNIITGETGAGKSILLGALSILLGDRFDKNVLYDVEKKCIIEAEFDIRALELKNFFQDHDLDHFDHCILRREINSSGRSRSFINDSPVNVKVIRGLAAQLIDIHSQHDILDLKSPAYQLDIIDLEAGNAELLSSFKEKYEALTKAENNLNKYLEDKEKGLSELDYLSYILNELEEAQLQIGEEEELLEEQNLLENAENIEYNINAVNEHLSGSNSAIELIDKALDHLKQLDKFMPEINSLSERLLSSNIELKDIATEIEQYQNQFEADPNRLENISTRLNLIYALERKHQVKSINELLEKEKEIADQVNSFHHIDEHIHQVKIEIQVLKEDLQKIGLNLRNKRKAAMLKIEKAINNILPEIGMPFALFKVDLTELSLDQIQSKGLDHVQFLLSPDKGNKYGPINKIASGGELSRIMLSIKSIIAQSNAIPSLIFDEIDTGISGDIASKVASLLESIAHQHQIISITHLPQIAAKGKHHLFVSKQMEHKKTVTKVKVLTKAERVQEIATMLSGKTQSEIAIKNASELLEE